VSEGEGMRVIVILSFERECCTFKTQGKIAFSAYKYTVVGPITISALIPPITSIAVFDRTDSMIEGVLVNFMLKGFWNRTTLNVKTVVTSVTCISEAMAITTTIITIYDAINVVSPCGEGKRMWMTWV
jgi:hypothetical protein